MSENETNKYFDEESLIEDDYYNSIKNMIVCKYCQKLFKEPMMCTECFITFCKKCTEEMGNECHECKAPKYVLNKQTKDLLEKLKYLCKNCNKEIYKADIEGHLKERCAKNENPCKLMDEIYHKNKLIRLNEDEIKKLHGKKINHITCKNLLLIIIIL